MYTKRTSIIWNIGDEEFKKIVLEAKSIADIVRFIGYSHCKTSYKTIYNRIKKDQIDISHIKLGHQSNLGRIFNTSIPVENYLCDGSFISSSKLKGKLLAKGILENKCSECGLKDYWNGRPISLHLDHINGISTDNRLENLRILCPNCHSQTETYSGRNIKQLFFCQFCGKKVYNKNISKCLACYNSDQKKSAKIKLDKEELEKLVWEKPTTLIAKMFNVSDTAIAKKCKKLGINKPPRGYWSKQKT